MSQYDFGSGLLIATPLTTINGTAVATPTPVQFGIMQDISMDIDAPIRELYGTYQFPVALGRGKGKIAMKARLAQFNANLWGTLFFGQTSSPAAGENIVSFQEAHTIPGSPYAVALTIPGSGTFVRDLGVKYAATGLTLNQVASVAGAGEYSLSGHTYTFDSADTTLGVLISYEYTVSGGYNIAVANQLMGEIVTFQATFQGTWSGKYLTIDFNNCVADKISLPTKLDDFIIHEFDFEAFADAAGNLFTISMAEQ